MHNVQFIDRHKTDDLQYNKEISWIMVHIAMSVSMHCFKPVNIDATSKIYKERTLQ